MKQYFNNCSTIEELKKEFHRWVKILHPDCGGDNDEYVRMYAEYEKMQKILQGRHNAAADEEHQVNEDPAEFADIIVKLVHLEGITIEICGSWLWISGNTYGCKEELKAAGCRFASKKKMWYWHSEENASSSRHSVSMEKIREKYGSKMVATAARPRIA